MPSTEALEATVTASDDPDDSGVDVLDQLTTQNAGAIYRCPGERGTISRAVHLARLSSAYAACQTCERRHEVGTLPGGWSKPVSLANAPVSTADSISGLLHNQLSRGTAERIVAAFVDQLSRLSSNLGTSSCPTVVVAQDGGAVAPELLVYVVPQVRRVGANVIDVGRVPRPCWQFAVQHLRAQGGVYVSGNSSGVAGLAFCGEFGDPWSLPGRLNALTNLPLVGTVRSGRTSGTYRTFDAVSPWRTGLQKYFGEMTRIALVASPLLQEMLARGPIPTGAELLLWKHMAPFDPAQFSQFIVKQQASCGVVLHDDDQSVTVFDAQGRVAAPDQVAVRLVETMSRRRSKTTVVSSTADFARLRAQLPAGRFRVLDGGDTAESLSRLLSTESADCGVGPGSRFWIRDSQIRCDALITLGLIAERLAMK